MKKTIIVAAAAAAYAACAEMEYATPESQGVDSAAISAWIDACEKTFDGRREGRIHGFVIARHGKTVAEGSWKPFDTLNETHMLYSHSKSFTSTAVGFLVDDGKLDLDERVVDIFPEKAPANPSANLRELRVRDLLAMNVGADRPDATRRNHASDWIATFLANPVDRKPGSAFKYDSSATYMLSAIVERRSGMKLMDWLREKMFSKIGVEKAWTTVSPQGIACGGWGMNMTTRELARFGVLYLQKGAWGGKTVLSPEWVELATSRHTWSNGVKGRAAVQNSKSDWTQGYGYQFWRCRHGAYRADGAFGQYTIVIPGKDAAISIHAGIWNMQKELDLVWDFLLPGMKDAPLPANPAGAEALARRCASLAIPPAAGSVPPAPAAFEGKTFKLKDNPRKIKSVRFDRDGAGWKCSLETRAGLQTFPVGCGAWRKGRIGIDTETYENLGMLTGRLDTAASGGVDAKGVFTMRAYLTGTTASIDFTIDASGRCTGNLFAMDGCRLQALP